MTEIQPTPGQTLAVLLGASVFRYAPKLAHGSAFSNSSQQFGQYLTGTMGVPEENVESFFNDRRPASEQLRDIRDFIERRAAELKNAGTPAHDLILHYVGHGLFCGGENDYCLAIGATDEQNEGFTSIRMRDLASVIRSSAAFVRKFLILDCCFSGAAYTQLQSGPLSVVQVKVRDVLSDESPQRGTSLLCSASAKDPSIAPSGLTRTMFSDSLLTVLAEGHEFLGPQLSFSEIGELVRLRIQEKYKDSGVRPEVHSPDQRAGDVARVPLFPNPAWARSNSEEVMAKARRRVEEERQRAEVERRRIESEERARLDALEARQAQESDVRKREEERRSREQAAQVAREQEEKQRREKETRVQAQEKRQQEGARELTRETEAPKTNRAGAALEQRVTYRFRWIVIAAIAAAAVYFISFSIYSWFHPVQWHVRRSGTSEGLNSIFGTLDGKHLWAVGIDGTIVQSDDAGASWQARKSGTSRMLNAIFGTPDGQHLWTVSSEGGILQSDDSGVTWKARESGTRNILSSIFSTSDGRHLWAVGNYGTIVQSNDAGASWAARSSENPLESISGTPDGRSLWAVGAGGQILLSNDGGTTWKTGNSGSFEWLQSIFATPDGLHLWAAGGEETVVHSDDGGVTWQKQRSGTFKSDHLHSIFGTSDGRHLWAVGGEGTILRSDDSGVTWEKQRSGTTEVLESIFGTPDGKHVWAVGLHGKILQFDAQNP
jgi:photosystem II stability/assembly factor-like uncharacterized protein